MRLLATAIFVLFLNLSSVPDGRAQEWRYVPGLDIGFETADSLARPYLATFDASGVLWVISSAADSQFAGAGLNALYRAEPGQDTFYRVQLYDRGFVYMTTGITAVGNDIYVSVRLTNPSNDRDPFHPYTAIYKYPAGSVDARQTFSVPIFDYGSWFTGITATPEGMIIAGRSWRPTIAAYDFTDGAAIPGATVSQAGTNEAALEPGGDMDGYGSNWIRDTALIPGGDYSNPSTPIYTSRNRSMYESGSTSGGIAVWTGGTIGNLLGYRAQRVFEPSGTLIFEGRHPNGITVDEEGHLYVANTFNRWVKVFEMFGNQALEAWELPSATTRRAGEQNAEGAPFAQPADVAIVPAEGASTKVYVIDRLARKAFFFTTAALSIDRGEGLPAGFELGQAYPNPFNPSAVIPFTLHSPSQVKVQVYDATGRTVGILVNEYRAAGNHRVTFDAQHLPSGLYIYRLQTESGSVGGRMTLIK
jgi:hypothetical protein